MRWRSALGLLLVLLASCAGAHAGGPLPGNRFPINSDNYYLTSETADVAGHQDVLTLAGTPPATQGMAQFLAPGVNVLGVLDTPSKMDWYATAAWPKDIEVTADAVAHLYFAANPQAVTVFEVRLQDVAPDGTATLVRSNVQQFIALGSPTPIDFPLLLAGVQFRQGHFLQLELYAQTGNAVIVLQHGGDTPTGLEGFAWRFLDSDGDGVSDSDELATGHNPLDPTDFNADRAIDTDRDGLPDAVEETVGTNAGKVDTDGDGFGDGIEVHAGSDPLSAASKPRDQNGNGLPDSFETRHFNTTNISFSSTPCTPGPNCVDPFADPDGDGCDNLCEAMHGTDPNKADSDGDGTKDGDEVAAGTSPTQRDVLVLPRQSIPEPIAAAGLFAGTSFLSFFALLRRP